MLHPMRTILCATFFALGGKTSFAKCFDFVGTGPVKVGPVALMRPADKVCVNHVNGFGHEYWSVRFADSQGDIAQLASQTELVERCLGFCRSYTLTSGNANGRNVNPDDTIVEFQVESATGELTIDHGNSGERTYRLTAEGFGNQPSSDRRFAGGQTVTGQVDSESFEVTINEEQTLALLVEGQSNQVLRYNPTPARSPRCLCRVYESGDISIAVEFRGNQAVGAYRN
jgi:hypothetical protein